jgi:hypothetical protein
MRSTGKELDKRIKKGKKTMTIEDKHLYRVLVGFLLMVLLWAAWKAYQAHSYRPDTEPNMAENSAKDTWARVLIPKGMPVSITVEREIVDQEVARQVIRRSAPPDVGRIRLMTMTDLDGERAIFDTKSPEMAVEPSKDGPLYVVVLRAETPAGVWVIDADDESKAIEGAIRGANSLRAKFIPR